MGGTKLKLTHHLLIAGALLVVAFAVIVARNWTTFALIYDNMTAMNEGGAMAQQIRYPSDLLDYAADHPEQVSLVAYDVGAEAEGIFYGAEAPRPVVGVPHLMLVAEYARQAAAGQLDPDRRVPLAALDRYALPGAGQAQHRQAKAAWRAAGHLDADSTVALRRVVQAIAQQSDRAAADWLMAHLGRERVAALPAQFGLGTSAPPQPASGTHLSWNHHRAGGTVAARLADFRAMPAASYADRVYQLTALLQADTSFRRQERARLRRRGTDLSLRHQRALAQATYPHGTATAYAGWMARLAQGAFVSDSVSAFLQRRLEQTVAADSVAADAATSDAVEAPALTIASKAGALPGLVSFVGYVRRGATRPPRVVALFMEGLPIGVFYHLMQTGLDRGLQLQLLTDDAFFQAARDRLHGTPVAARAGREGAAARATVH